MNTKQQNSIFAHTMYGMVILAIVFSVSTSVYAAPSSPFVGHWQAIDLDESDIRLTIGGPSNGPFQITWTDSHMSFCDGEAGIVRGTGALNDSDPYLLEADLHVECFTTSATEEAHLTLRYHPTTNTLSVRYGNGSVIIWHRPGGPLPLPPTLNLRVNYGHDWVESFYEGGHTAWVTVTDGDGNVKATAELVTEPKDFWGGETGFQTQGSDWSDADGNQMDNPPDIQPYDWVYGWVDNGASAQVQIGDISGMIDLAADSIGGTINVPWFFDEENPIYVDVECLDWGSGGGPFNKYGGSILTNGADAYFCSWDPLTEWDIQPGQNVGIGYLGPDGHWVANAFYIPRLVLYIHYEYPDVVEGSYELGHTVQVTVFDSEWNTKATATVNTMEMPHWGGAPGFRVEQWNGIEGPPDIQPGDVVRAVVDDGFLTTDARIGEIAATIDLDTNSITGTINAPWTGDHVNVLCMPWGALGGASDKETTVIPDGVSEFTCSWDSEWDIQPGGMVGVAYWGNDLHWVANAFFEPATIMVNSTADALADDGFCTLREAVIAANTNAPSGEAIGECPGGLDFATDTILLVPDQTYYLTIDSTYEDGATDGDLDIWDNSAATDLIAMVEGSGTATISQDANADDRVLENHGAMVQIENMTLTGGGNVQIGGGVHNAGGTLIMSADTVTGNMADYGGGIYNDTSGTLILTGSTVSGNMAAMNGGGLENGGTLTVDASTFSANTATYGGGALFTYLGTVTIQNGSVFGGDPNAGQGNTANYGGGIAVWSGNLNLSNSTISGNSVTWVGGAIRNVIEGTVTVSDSTISGNSAEWDGGGILNEGTMTLNASEVSTNTATYQGGGLGNFEGDLTIMASTVSGNSSGNGGGVKNWPNSTLVIDASTFVDNHAGGGGGLDNEGGTATIRNGSQFTGNTVGWIGGAISNVSGGVLLMEGSSIISVNSSDGFAGGLYNDSASTLTVNNSTITGNVSIYGGGGIVNDGTLAVENSVLSRNKSNQGGGLYNPGTATIINTTVGGSGDGEGNIGNDGGGGLFNVGMMTVTDSFVIGNNGTTYGGGLFNWIGGMLTISNSAVSGNSANEGGGLHNKEGSTAIIQNGSIFSGNHARFNVGGIQNWGTLTITDSVLRENTSPGEDGNAIANTGPEGSIAGITASCIVGNGNTAVFNALPVLLNATGNWWGDASGPSGMGPGFGDSVSGNVDFSNWLTEPPAICAP